MSAAGEVAPAVRELSGTGDGPALVDVTLDVGRVEVDLGAPAGDATDPVHVRVEAVAGGPGLLGGLAEVLGRLGDGLTGSRAEDRVAAALAATTMVWDAEARRVEVRGSRELALRSVALLVTVRAPESSGVRVRAGAAEVTVRGRADDVTVHATGAVGLDRVDGRLRIAGGAGHVDVARVLGPAEITTGAGRVRLGEVAADTAVRAAAGDLEVADAAAGELDLTTGAGSVRVGIRHGVDARVDLHAAAGRATSDLPVSPQRDPAAPGTEERPAVRVRGRTAAGHITVGRAEV
jgi:hypothetical protein